MSDVGEHDHKEYARRALFGDLRPKTVKETAAGHRRLDERDSWRDTVLRTTLLFAVPSFIADLATISPDERDLARERLAYQDGETLLASMEEILYRTTKRGSTKTAFNAVARGIAVCAFNAGGVHVFGLTWCAEHSPGGADVLWPCPRCVDQ